MKPLLFTLALSIALAAQDHPAPETSIRHVTIINIQTGAELKDQTVRIRGK